MKVMVGNIEKDAEISEYRCRDFVSASLFVDGQQVPLSETVTQQYKLVEASDREKEVLKGWGYRLDGLPVG